MHWDLDLLTKAVIVIYESKSRLLLNLSILKI